MVDFAKLLSSETRERLAAENAAIERLYYASDVELAQQLLDLARTARALRPEYHGTAAQRDRHYGTSMVWAIVPEIAYALAERAGVDLLLNDDEGSADLRLEIVTNQTTRARHHVGAYLKHNGRLARPPTMPETAVDPWDLLTHLPCNGNPIAFALDRLIAPPADRDRDDYIASLLLEISHTRGHTPTTRWHPGLQSKPTKAA